jgi:HK97 family phage major capsid protein
MPKLTEIREKQAKLVADARAKLDEIVDGTPEARARELEAEHDRIMAEWDRLEGLAKREEQLASREAELARGDPRRPRGEDATVTAEPAADAEEARASAFRAYLRGGLDGMTAEERKLLREMRAQSTADAQGGYTIPQGFMAELIVSLKAWGPMLDPGVTRQLVTATGNQIDWPTLNDTGNQAYRLGENAQVTGADGDLAFGNKQLDAYKYASGAILVSSELMQDSAFDIEAIIRAAIAERFGRKLNADLTTGDGAGDPNGIVTASMLGTNAAAAAAISFDDLIELEHSLDPAYRADPSCRWMFHDTSLKQLRKVKDLEGNYIWQPADARSGAPAAILNHPYVINQAMAVPAATARSVLFGAMNRYIVRRVQEIAIRRLVERYADFDQVGFIGFARFDGELLDTAAVKHLAHPA